MVHKFSDRADEQRKEAEVVRLRTPQRRALGADERTATEKNLHAGGYDGWKQLYLRTSEFDGPSVAPFKTWARRDIEAQGYTIIANVGDQWSDFKGGHAERRFKIPNPFYFIQ